MLNVYSLACHYNCLTMFRWPFRLLVKIELIYNLRAKWLIVHSTDIIIFKLEIIIKYSWVFIFWIYLKWTIYNITAYQWWRSNRLSNIRCTIISSWLFRRTTILDAFLTHVAFGHASIKCVACKYCQ